MKYLRLLLAVIVAWFLAIPAYAQSPTPFAFTSAQPTNPTGNATTSFAMQGLGVSGAGGGWFITPQLTGKVTFDIIGGIANGTASDGAALAIVVGATSVVAAPANAAAVPGTATVCTNAATGMTNNASTAAVVFPFHLMCVMQLTPRQQWWADIELKSVTGGTSTLTGLQVFAAETQ